MQVGQETGGQLIFGDTPGMKVLIQEWNGIDQDVVAVVTKSEPGAWFIHGESGGTAENFYAKFYQPTGYIVGLNRIGRLNFLVLIEIDV